MATRAVDRAAWRRLLVPRSIALVGASESGFASRYTFENLRAGGFQGEIIPINPRHSTVFGRRAYPSLDQAPPADAAMILVARASVEDTVGQALRAGVGGLIVITGGFRETGEPEWVAAEARMAAAAREAGVPLIGPNCLGVMALPAGALMSIGPYPWSLTAGSVALLMQSGGQLIASCRYVNELGAGLRYAFSLGNATSVSFAEVLDALADDPEVRECVLLIEEIPDWPAFRAAMARVREAGQWVGAVTIGRTRGGQRAAATHTGALAGDHDVLMSGLAQVGVRPGETLGSVLAAAVLHARFGRPRAGQLAIVGVSGGGAGLAADAAGTRGLPLAELTTATRNAIRQINPQTRPDNPLDIVGGPMDRPRFRAVLEACLRDPHVGLGLYLPSQGVPDERTPEHLETLGHVVEAAGQTGTPVVISQLVFAPIPEAQRAAIVVRPNVCLLPSAEEAVAAIDLWRSDPLDLMARARGRPGAMGHADTPGEGSAGPVAYQVLHEADLKAVLARFGCQVPPGVFLPLGEPETPTGGLPVGERVGWPVVVKGIGRRIFHKTRAGLVRLGVTGPEALREALEALRNAAGRVDVDGILVERQIEAGTDVMVSVCRDRLGTVVVVAEGGGRAGEAGTAAWLGIDPTPAELRLGAERVLGALGADHRAPALVEFTERLRRAHQAEGWTLLEVNPARVLPSGDVVVLDAVAT